MLVVDASILAAALGTDDQLGAASLDVILGPRLAAPDLMRVEVLSVWRRQVFAGRLDPTAAESAVASLLELDIDVFSNTLLLQRSWELRDNLTTYDACSVALAEALGCPLATADQRLANAPGSRCEFVVVAPAGNR